MGILRKASQETVTLKLDEESWVEVRKELDHGLFEKVVEKLPQSDGDTLSGIQSLQAAKLFFEVFVTAWSLDEPPTVEVYNSLPPEATNAIASALAEHFNSLSVNQQESK